MRIILVLLLLFSSSNAQNKSLTHVVLCWLDSTVSPQEIDSLISLTYDLKEIPGIMDLYVGKPVSSERPIVDDSFTFGITMTFADAESMNHYLADKRHTSFVAQNIKPRLNRIIVYDIQ